MFPYAPMVPRDPVANSAWREWISERGRVDELDRRLILEACERDLLFFINGFLWIKQEQPVPEDLLFLTWPRQEEYVAELVRTRVAVQADRTGTVVGNILSEKPREVGWSWLNLAEGLHIARFQKGATCLVGSRVEEDVDKPGASKTLFWKLDYYIEKLPLWFMPDSYWSPKHGHPIPSKNHRTTLKLSIPGFGTILGAGTTPNFGRSGRFVWMMLDEFAHVDRGQFGMGDMIWSATTKTCRLRRVFSTPSGRGNKFATLRHGDSLPVFCVDWTDDPAKMQGAYRLEQPLEVGPVTVPAGSWWSPWAEATRKSDDNDALFAQEVLRSYEGLGGSFYDKFLPRIKAEQVREPTFVGNIKIEDGPYGPRITRFVAETPAFMRVWDQDDSRVRANEWPRALYCMGIDVASGSSDQDGRGASNSVVAIGRIEGQKVVKVAQYVTHGLLPHLFARVVHALGWCFRTSDGLPAYAQWERNGPGDIMGSVLIRQLRYSNYYTEMRSKRGMQPGFSMNTHRGADGKMAGSKVNCFNEHKMWISLGDYAEPSYETYAEMEQYKYTDDGGAEHHKKKGSLDPAEGRENHGDSVIATIMMIWAAKTLRDQAKAVVIADAPPPMSVAWAQAKRKRELQGLWR